MGIPEILGEEYAHQHNMQEVCEACVGVAAEKRPADVKAFFADYFSGAQTAPKGGLSEADTAWLEANKVREKLSDACVSLRQALPNEPLAWLANHFKQTNTVPAPPRGPYSVDLEAGRSYFLCTCGQSKKQPFCDGAHNAVNQEHGTSFRPRQLKAEKTETISVCGCPESRETGSCGCTDDKGPMLVPDIEDVPPKCAQCKPYVEAVQSGKKYMYCACGHTDNQPYCDGTHRAVNKRDGTSFAPKAYTAPETGRTAFCGCRRTKAPEGIKCDGTHRSLDADGIKNAPTPTPEAPAAGPSDATKFEARVACRGPIYEDVEVGKTYYYCTCGYSRNQPYCDGSHRAINEEHGTNFKPTPYTPEFTTTVSFCGCRKSLEGAICDGSHLDLPAEVGGRDIVAYDFVPHKVIETTSYNHDSQVIKLKSDTPGEPLETSYHFSVRIDGKVRPYTPITYDAAKGEVSLVIKKVDGGAVSPAMVGMKVGDVVEMKGPAPGEYHWQKGVHKSLLLLGGGSGLTPVFQVLQQVCLDLADEAVPSTVVHLVFSNKTVADILLREEIEAWAKKYPAIVKTAVLCVTRDSDVPAPLHKGRMDADLISTFISPEAVPTSHVLICGTPEYNKASAAICTKLGYENQQITVC